MHFKQAALFLLLLSIGFSSELAAQRYKENTPLHKFLQESFDSTIIYYSWSNWYPWPNYLIIPKMDNSVYFFTYKSPYQMIGGTAPKILAEKFVHEEIRFRKTPPDTNRYFLPHYLKSRNRNSLWQQINDFNIWNLKEINVEDAPCDSYDDSEETFYLITKDTIKVLNYYALDLFETCRPKNINRQNAIKTRDQFKKVFGN